MGMLEEENVETKPAVVRALTGLLDEALVKLTLAELTAVVDEGGAVESGCRSSAQASAALTLKLPGVTTSRYAHEGTLVLTGIVGPKLQEP